MPEWSKRSLTKGKTYAAPLLILLLGAAAFSAVRYRSEIFRLFSSPDVLQNWVRAWGWKAPFAFVLLQFFQVVVFFIPGEIPQIAGGYLFGTVEGSLLSSFGILMGSTFNFFLARMFGLPLVVRLFGREKVARFEGFLYSRRAVGAFFLLFVVPGIPKDFLCYLAGLASFRFPAFMAISFIGRLPGILGSSFVGNAAAQQQWVFAGVLVAAAGLLFLAGIRWRNRFQAWLERFILRKDVLPPRDERRREEV